MGTQSSKLCKGHQQHGLQDEYQALCTQRRVTQEGKLILKGPATGCISPALSSSVQLIPALYDNGRRECACKPDRGIAF